jgi:AICAR transformylase/IMP cyclohydrolase PurH
VSDGIIAPGYEPKALEILSAKKSGAFIVLEANADYVAPDLEYREVGGYGLCAHACFSKLTLMIWLLFSCIFVVPVWCLPRSAMIAC